MTRVLVTGATGFVGCALCRALAAAGMPVVMATRNPSNAKPLPGADIRAITGVGPRVDWGSVLRGVDAVVHLAARTPVLGEEETAAVAADYQRVNVEGAHKLAMDAARAGVERFVFVSTAKVHGEASPPGAVFSEESPLQPESAYARSKAEAEHQLVDVAAATGLELVIVRPPVVYGAGVRGNFLAFLQLAARAPVLPFGAVQSARSMIYVSNLADALIRAAAAPKAAGGVYLVRDGEDLTTPALIRTFTAALGRRPTLLAVPPALLQFAAAITGRSAAVGRLMNSFLVDDAKIRRELGWTPPVSVLQGMDETAQWFATKAERS